MAFKSIATESAGLDFNSQISSNFRDLYTNLMKTKYENKAKHLPSKTFAPSSFRCDRLSFFRLRGVEPDPVYEVNMGLEFSAILGTACHLEIQDNLKSAIGDQWVDVKSYLESTSLSHEFKINNHGEFETQIEFLNPPVRFSCDGLLRLNNQLYLLEIKTSEYQSFKTLKEPKSQHIDQVKCYCSLLEINKALVLYQDRLYGEVKCYEVDVYEYEMRDIFKRMDYVLDCVEKNIAPPRLDRSDYWCTYCKYAKRCKQWG